MANGHNAGQLVRSWRCVLTEIKPAQPPVVGSDDDVIPGGMDRHGRNPARSRAQRLDELLIDEVEDLHLRLGSHEEHGPRRVPGNFLRAINDEGLHRSTWYALPHIGKQFWAARTRTCTSPKFAEKGAWLLHFEIWWMRTAWLLPLGQTVQR